MLLKNLDLNKGANLTWKYRGRPILSVGGNLDFCTFGVSRAVEIGDGLGWQAVTPVHRRAGLILEGCRPTALPVLAVLVVKGGRSRADLARDLVDLLAERFPDRGIDVVADAAYGCGAFAGLGTDMTMTTRARSNAAFYRLSPPRTGKRGRPRLKRDKIGTPATIATSAAWKRAVVSRYGTAATVQIAERVCLW